MAFETISTGEMLYEVRIWSLIRNAFAVISVLLCRISKFDKKQM